MTDWEEKTCQLCIGIAGLFHRREYLISNNEIDRINQINELLQLSIEDLKFWLLKNG